MNETQPIIGQLLNLEPQPTRITRIQIQRLHNLGNYESVRYEVTVDVAPTDDAGKVLTTLETALEDVQARSDYTTSRYERALNILSEPVNQWGEAWTELEIEGAKGVIAAYEAAQAKRVAARELLSSLSCVKEKRDAKENWDNDEDYQ